MSRVAVAVRVALFLAVVVAVAEAEAAVAATVVEDDPAHDVKEVAALPTTGSGLVVETGVRRRPKKNSTQRWQTISVVTTRPQLRRLLALLPMPWMMWT